MTDTGLNKKYLQMVGAADNLATVCSFLVKVDVVAATTHVYLQIYHTTTKQLGFYLIMSMLCSEALVQPRPTTFPNAYQRHSPIN